MPFRFEKLENLVFFLFLFFLPSSLAYHFKTSYSVVLGIYRDYLMPAVYLTDLLIIVLLVLWVYAPLRERTKARSRSALTRNVLKKVLILLLPFFFIFPAKNHWVAVYKAVKLSEFILLFYWLKSKKIKLQTISLGLLVSAVFQSILALVQWLKQTSVLAYIPFGEPVFNELTLNIKRVVFFDGSLKITPMGTFSHSNVLAAFLLFVISLNLLLPHRTPGVSKSLTPPYGGVLYLKKQKLLMPFYLLLISALLLTFSLSAIILLVIFIFLLLFRKKPVLSLIISGALTACLIAFFSQDIYLSFISRLPLFKSAVLMIKDHPIFGVGLNNFLVELAAYIKPKDIYFFQPVHNVFMLLLSETGAIGLLIFTSFLLAIFRELFKSLKANWFKIFLLASWFILSLFDHYFYSLQQGLLLSTIIFYLCSEGIIKKKFTLKTERLNERILQNRPSDC